MDCQTAPLPLPIPSYRSDRAEIAPRQTQDRTSADQPSRFADHLESSSSRSSDQEPSADTTAKDPTAPPADTAPASTDIPAEVQEAVAIALIMPVLQNLTLGAISTAATDATDPISLLTAPAPVTAVTNMADTGTKDLVASVTTTETPEATTTVQTALPETILPMATPAPVAPTQPRLAAADMASNAKVPAKGPVITTGTTTLAAAAPSDPFAEIAPTEQDDADTAAPVTAPAAVEAISTDDEAEAEPVRTAKPIEDTVRNASETHTSKANGATRTERTEAGPADRAVAAQVARAVVQQITDGQRTLTLRLTPAELGTVRIHLSESGGQMQVRLSAEDEGVRAALERALPQLKQDLRQSATTVSELTVADQFLAFAQHQQKDDDARQSGRGTGRNETDAAFAVDGVLPNRRSENRPPPRRRMVVGADAVDVHV